MDLAVGLIQHYAPENRAVATKVRNGLASELDSIPTKMLAEYFCKPQVAHDLFGIAKEFEAAAYNTQFVSPALLSPGCRSVFGLFLDFWNLDRVKFLSDQSPRSVEVVAQPRQEGETREHSADVQQPKLPGLGS
jgi:hypothetical protein